jgi:hypothetical protein
MTLCGEVLISRLACYNVGKCSCLVRKPFFANSDIGGFVLKHFALGQYHLSNSDFSLWRDEVYLYSKVQILF